MVVHVFPKEMDLYTDQDLRDVLQANNGLGFLLAPAPDGNEDGFEMYQCAKNGHVRLDGIYSVTIERIDKD